MDTSIQYGSMAHHPGIHALVLDWGYSVSEATTRQWLDAILESPDHQIFVAVSGDLVVGWAVAEKRITLAQGLVTEISALVVSSGFRRSGLGKRLVNAVEQWSLSMGLHRLVVRSNVSRVESHEFYPSIGFELTKTSHVYTRDLVNSDQ
jgi:GNAT superfamily N-acetyltransferase